MQYISKIETARDGRVASYMYRTWLDDSQLAITVHDTVTGEDKIAYHRNIMKLEPVGFGENVTFDACGLVTHDIKTSSLYRYIYKSESQGGIVGLGFDASDMIEMGENGELDFLWVEGKKNIIINTGHDIFNVRGKHGSVVTKFFATESRIECYNLYNFLAMMCQRFKVNLLRYHNIWFYSKNGNYTLTVGLKHTPEAERFFTKMYMDICSQG